MVVMAHKMNIKVVAEGVETAVQHKLLSDIGCEYAQGYYYSRPLPAKELECLLAQGELWSLSQE
jgi:EAL domain-containing protein (putative c-di-GMP-specific phosphodiesterase class I)